MVIKTHKIREECRIYKKIWLNMHIDIGLQDSYNRSYLTVVMYCIETNVYYMKYISKERRICVESVQSRARYPFSHPRRCA